MLKIFIIKMYKIFKTFSRDLKGQSLSILCLFHLLVKYFLTVFAYFSSSYLVFFRS